MSKILNTIILLSLIGSCSQEPIPMSEDNWRLGWRMIESNWNEKYELAENQFDSLLNTEEVIEDYFIVNGLEVKTKLSKHEEVLKIMLEQSKKWPPIEFEEIIDRKSEFNVQNGWYIKRIVKETEYNTV